MAAAGMTGPSWKLWRVFWKSVFALKMDPEELRIVDLRPRCDLWHLLPEEEERGDPVGVEIAASKRVPAPLSNASEVPFRGPPAVAGSSAGS